MQSTYTTDQIAELTLLIHTLENKQDQLTDEEHTLLSPIMEAAQPLLDSLEETIATMDALDEDCSDEDDEEEDWTDI